MFPFIPVVAWLVTLAGGGSLLWYYNLSEAERKRADKLAGEIAHELYGVAVDKLTESQAKQVQARLKSHTDD
jgi:hypothetical protein